MIEQHVPGTGMRCVPVPGTLQLKRLLPVCFLLLPIMASAAIVPSCGDSPTDSGPIPFSVFSAPDFACQQQNTAYTNFAFNGLPSTSSLRLTHNNVADFDFHTVSFTGNFQGPFSLTYVVSIDRSLNPQATIGMIAADLSSSIPVGNPTLKKLVQTIYFVNLGTTTTTRTLPGMPLIVDEHSFRITDTYTPNGGVATLIGNTFRQDLNAVPEPSTLVLAGGALIIVGLLRRKRARDVPPVI